MADNAWWDGYQGEEVVIIDDFDKYHVKQGFKLKLWGDRYTFPAEVKGSARFIRPKKVIVTSNYHPKDIWEDKNTLEPILQRFEIVHFVTPNNGVFGNTRETTREGYNGDTATSSTAPNFAIPDTSFNWDEF